MADEYYYNPFQFDKLINQLQLAQDRLLEASASLETLLADIQADENWVNMNKQEVEAFLQLINMVNKDLFCQNEEGSESAVQSMLEVLRQHRDTMDTFYDISPAFGSIKEGMFPRSTVATRMYYDTWLERSVTNQNVLAHWSDILELNDLILEANNAILESDCAMFPIEYEDLTEKIYDSQYLQGIHQKYIDEIGQEMYDVDEKFAKEVSSRPLKKIDGIDISEYSTSMQGVEGGSLQQDYCVLDFVSLAELEQSSRLGQGVDPEYEEVQRLLQKCVWTEEEKEFLCVRLENYCKAQDAVKLEGFFGGLITETFEERQNGESLRYTVSGNSEETQSLLEKAVELECPYAYEYLVAVKQVMPNAVETGKRESCHFKTHWMKQEDNTAILQVSVYTDMSETNYWATVEHMYIKGDLLSDYGWATGQNQESLQEEIDRFEEVGLTGYVKCGYHEIVDSFSDDTILFLARSNPVLCVGSHVQAHVIGEPEKTEHYMLVNGRSWTHGQVDGFWDFSLGQKEEDVKSIGNGIKTLFLEPGAYMKSVLTGECEDTGAECVLKFTGAFVQVVTGTPVYNNMQEIDNSAPAVKEAVGQCAEMLTVLKSITPQEWKDIGRQSLEEVGGTLQETVTEAGGVLNELIHYTPEQWEDLAIRTCKRANEMHEANVQNFFSEENIEALSYGGGYVKSAVDGTGASMLMEFVLGTKLAGALGKFSTGKPQAAKGVSKVGQPDMNISPLENKKVQLGDGGSYKPYAYDNDVNGITNMQKNTGKSPAASNKTYAYDNDASGITNIQNYSGQSPAASKWDNAVKQHTSPIKDVQELKQVSGGSADVLDEASEAALKGNPEVDVKRPVVNEGGNSSKITNKFPNEAMPVDGKIIDYYIENGRIKGIEGLNNVDFVITTDNKLIIGNKHHYLGNGQDALAAGQLKINGQGQIKRIDNSSGHYCPTVDEAMGYQALFENLGLDLNNTWLEYYRFEVDADGWIVGKYLEYVKMVGGS